MSPLKARPERSERNGLPREAFAIPGDAADPGTWKLPHHRKVNSKRQTVDRLPSTVYGLRSIEVTVDWDRMSAAVAALSPGGFRGQRVQASAEQIIAAARHLAAHYRHAGKPVPDTLQALI